MFFKVVKSFSELINRKATIGSEENVDVTYTANVTTIKYYSYSVNMFPETSPTNFADQGSIYKVNVVQRKTCWRFFLHCCNIFHKNTWKLLKNNPTSSDE